VIINSALQTLLLVEDNSDDEALSLLAISRSGVPCEVGVVRHGGDALDVLLSPEGPVPSLVVLDFHLPGYNGLEILRAIRSNERTRHVPVVMLSSFESDKQIKECLKEGARSYVLKPTDSQVYIENVGLIIRYWLTVDRSIDKPPTLRLLT
jgi:CheY-like chemotaxis protein